MGQALNVLVVDDDEAIVEMVKWALSEEGHTVSTAANGAIALEMLEQLRPDLILLDMRMPVMDGWQFAEAFRQRPDPKSPIVVMTAARDAAQRAREIAADGYLAKPFDIDDLIATVRRFALVH
ncbi:MAG: response regulator [Chloroflexota bacterium]|nr:MAG: response regulator [Chloroflexota bacterium]